MGIMQSRWKALWIGWLAMAVSGAMGQTASTAPAAPPEADAGVIQQLRDIVDQLNLSDNQKTGLRAILQQARSDGQQLRGQLEDLSPPERVQKLRDFFNGVETQIEGQLTPEQNQLFQSKVAAIRSQLESAGRGNPFQRIREVLNQLNLTADQQAKVGQVLDAAANKAEQLRSSGNMGQGQIRQVFEDARQQIEGILTAAQIQEFREQLQQVFAGGSARPGGATAGATVSRPPAQAPGRNTGSSGAGGSGPVPGDLAATGLIEPGTQAPEFNLAGLETSPVRLSSLKGRVVVLIFGSYSSPIFRQRAAGLDQMARQLEEKASIFLIYTKEAHPSDGWELDRNKQDGVVIGQAASEEARRNTASQAVTALHLSMPILLDDMQNSVATAYGAFPDGAVVIDRDGAVVGSQRWAEPVSLSHIVNEAVGGQTTARQ